MITQKWNDDWRFWIDQDAFALVWNVPEEAEQITLPHDAMIANPADAGSLNQGNTGYRSGAVYSYVKSLYAPDSYRRKTIKLKFEGVYMNAFVYVNGQLAAKNPFGYSGFYVDLTDYLIFNGKNEIRVQVRNGAMANSRWYSGGGIYRDVYLLVSELLHIIPDGLQIKTETADLEYAVLRLRVTVKNRGCIPVSFHINTKILDQNGRQRAAEDTLITLLEGEERQIYQRFTVTQPQLWSAEQPSLYRCRCRIGSEAKTMDEDTVWFGIRTLTLDAKRGLRVNGETVKLRGACIHHDSGLLGAATYEDAQIRQVKKLKAAGFNAIRMAHQPMAEAMLRACDRFGMYVMDESFDMWNRAKTDYDYSLYFAEWWETDLTAMVRKDYNHPAVILYSIGNEIPEIGTVHGAAMCQKLCAKVRSLDDTRYILAAINGVFAAGDAAAEIVREVTGKGSAADDIQGNVNDLMTAMDTHLDAMVNHPIISKRLEAACASTDLAGYNYMTARYEPDGQAYPNRIIVGSETYPPAIAKNWELVRKLPYVIGDFTWAGWDYIGEAGVGIPAYQWGEGGFGAGFPCQLAYVGDFDITGFRRPASYYREIVFDRRKKPYITVQNPHKYEQQLIKTPWVISDSSACWNWDGCEGQPVIVEVYAAGTEVELYCNGKLQGRKVSGSEAQYRTLFECRYEPGILTAVVYENDQEIARSELITAGAQQTIQIEAEAGTKELLYVPITLTDDLGHVDAGSSMRIHVFVQGGADLIGLGSGNPKPLDHYHGAATHLYGGRALAILKKNQRADEVQIEVRPELGKKVIRRFDLSFWSGKEPS